MAQASTIEKVKYLSEVSEGRIAIPSQREAGHRHALTNRAEKIWARHIGVKFRQLASESLSHE